MSHGAPAFVYGRAALFEADCFEWLADAPPSSVQAVVTDPSYGLVDYSEAEQAKLRAEVSECDYLPAG